MNIPKIIERTGERVLTTAQKRGEKMPDKKKAAENPTDFGSTAKAVSIMLTIAELAILIAAAIAMILSKVDLYQNLMIFYLLCFKAQRK